MNKIYLTCRMRVRQAPTLSSDVIKILEKDQIIPVIDIMPKCDGYFWFKVEDGYVANIEEVFYHSDDYHDTRPIKIYVSDILDQSVDQTARAVDEIKKTLDAL